MFVAALHEPLLAARRWHQDAFRRAQEIDSHSVSRGLPPVLTQSGTGTRALEQLQSGAERSVYGVERTALAHHVAASLGTRAFWCE